jgi:hypothetical protein
MDPLQLTPILDAILDIRVEEQTFGQAVKEALTQRPSSDQYRIRSFAYSIWQNCDNIHKPVPDYINENNGNRSQDYTQPALESNIESPLFIDHGGTLEDDSLTLQKRNDLCSHDAQLSAHENDVGQSAGCYIDGEKPQLICDAEEDRNTPDLRGTEAFGPGLESSNKAEAGAVVSSMSSSVANTIIMASSSPSISMNFETMPSPTGYEEHSFLVQEDRCGQHCLALIDQGIDDFVYDSQQQVGEFSSPGNSGETYKALSDLLKDGTENSTQDQVQWSDGTEWLSLLESWHGERKKGTIRYAITAMAFARWHTSSVRLIKGEKHLKRRRSEYRREFLGRALEMTEIRNNRNNNASD